MKKILSLSIVLSLFYGVADAQSVITQWNFNSSPSDGSTSTGSSTPSLGVGILSNIGGVTSTFSSGAASGGSSDPASSDNSGYQTTTYAAQGNEDKMRGVEFAVSTVGFENIRLGFDLRYSNTSSKYQMIQYTGDITASPVVWTDFDTAYTTVGDAWVNGRVKDFSTISLLNDNPNVGFRIVNTFAPGTSAYAAANPTGTYAASGTLRYDMVTISGNPVSAPTSPVDIQFVGNYITVTEDSLQFAVIAKILGNYPDFASVELALNSLSTSNVGIDFAPLGDIQFNWAPNAANTNDTVLFNIVNDSDIEATEYAIFNFTNPQNTNIPSDNSGIYTVFIQDNDYECIAFSNPGSLTHVTSFSNGVAGTNSSEIVGYDSISDRLFIANSIGGKIDIVDFSTPASPSLISSIAINPTYGNINSLAVKNGIVAAAIENLNPQLDGSIVFFDTNGVFLNSVTAGAMPDMIIFNHEGTKVLTGNEGEPNADYTSDPEGSVTIVDISGGVASATATQVNFNSWNDDSTALKAMGVRIFGPGATVSQDLEPEYISFSSSGDTAFVSCQENNTIAVLDITTQQIVSFYPLGLKDHNLPGKGLDANDQTGNIHIANWPVKGVFMPDAISTFNIGGVDYIISANEGDAREYNTYAEVLRLSSNAYNLDTVAIPNHREIKKNLGRLNVTTASGDLNGDSFFEEIHAFGARSVSIWNAETGTLVWDSGDMLEQMIACHPVWKNLFNASNSNNTFKNRSDDKGPEPEGVTTKTIGSQTYAFVTLERIGGVVILKVTDPSNPVMVDYLNTRSSTSYGGDNGAEGILVFQKGSNKGYSTLASGEYYVIAANEVSSTLAVYQFTAPVPLPIIFGDITAYKSGNDNKVEWTMSVKGDNNNCYLEHSNNGLSFSELTQIAVNENATNYSYLHFNPLSENNFYRIRMNDELGKTTYSKIVSVNNKKSDEIVLFPNPAQNEVFVITKEKADYSIFELNGKELSNGKFESGMNKVNTENLPSGIYSLRITNTLGNIQIVRFVNK